MSVLAFVCICIQFYIVAILISPTSCTYIDFPPKVPVNTPSDRYLDLVIAIKKRSASGEQDLVRRRRSTNSHMVDGHQNVDRKATCLDMSRYTNILSVDVDNRLVIVECGCNMKKLVNEVTKYKMLPKVLPELQDITVGGAVVGGALETSSFRFGQFNDICRRIWVLVGDGRIIECSKFQNTDLWLSLSGSYGTLGIVLCVELECIPYKDWVAINATSFYDRQKALSYLKKSSEVVVNNKYDFIEAIEYPNEKSDQKSSSSMTVVMTASLVDNPPTNSKIYDPKTFNSKWFYEYIKHLFPLASTLIASCSSTITPTITRSIYIPTKSYLFRHERGAFWMARPQAWSWKAFFAYPMTGILSIMTDSNIIARTLFRWFFTTSRLYKLLRRAHPLIVRQRMIIMDVYVPIDNVSQFLSLIRNTIPLTTPLWLCPVRRVPSQRTQPFSPHGHTSSLLVDVGVYGRVSDALADRYSSTLEQWALAYNSRKMLYSQHNYTESDFWKGHPSNNNNRNNNYENHVKYDKSKYQQLREKYSAEGVFPNLYSKICIRHKQSKKGFRYWLTWLGL